MIRRRIITILTIFFLCINCFYFFIHTMSRVANKNPLMLLEPGYQYESFLEPLKYVKRVGYLTDKEISREKNDGYYLMAQYYLAPTIVDLNSDLYDITILDFKKPAKTILTMRILNAKTIAYTKNDVILSEKQAR